jgi:hypothetical protein
MTSRKLRIELEWFAGRRNRRSAVAPSRALAPGAALAAAVLLAAACGSPSQTQDSGHPDVQSTNDVTTVTDTGGGTEGGGNDVVTTTDVITSDMQCGTLGPSGCRQCCTDRHMTGQQSYDMLFHDCVCMSGNCSDQCSQSVCADPPNGGPTPSCNDCLDRVQAADGGCSNIQAMCTGDCAGYTMCLTYCQR